MTGIPPPGSGRPIMVPFSSKVKIARPGLADSAVEILVRDQRPAVALSAALQGTGGFGKTTLAEMICADPRINRAFPGGILWVTMGDGGSEARLSVKISEIVRVLTEKPLLITDPDKAGRALGDVLGDSRCLLVVDDVWTAGQLTPFLTGAPSCARLLTTRNWDVAATGSARVRVEAMEPDEAKALLLANLPTVPDDQIAPLLGATGRWPILLALINGTLNMLVNDQGNSIADALAEAELRLRSAGPIAFDPARARSRSDAVQATLEVSLEFLKNTGRPGDYRRYLELAIFPENEPVPMVALERWWGQQGEMEPADARRLCQRLAELSLILRYQVNPAQIQLHDVVLRYLRLHVGDRLLREMRNQWLSLRPRQSGPAAG
jgi:hypothetical protein